jgi:rSAM/selenodomain-associated transferase 2/rSAM/selenodomain-associated transferase 1
VKRFVEPSIHRSSSLRGQSSLDDLAVIIPTLNEARSLPSLLGDLVRLRPRPRIVVVDGGSSDSTVEVARAQGVRVVSAPRGRACQMNVGAASVPAPWLLFLHADSRLPRPTRLALARWLDSPPPEAAAHFAFQLDAEGLWWSILEGGQRLRERFTGLAYGDQGLLMSRERWAEMGGIPEIPLMEDVEAVRRLRESGGIGRISAPVVTSARRYRREGRFRGWFRNATLITLYHLGVPPRRLASFYPAGNGLEAHVPEAASPLPPSRPDRCLVVAFAKAPRPGRVKTRLARELGDEAASDLYRRMGKLVLDQLRGGPYRLRVVFDPPDAADEVSEWLGTRGVEYAPQPRGTLGDRMKVAMADGFSVADRVCLVGTDTPQVGRELVEKALAGLNEADVVIGPARDGGYYLLALRRSAPALFHGIPWSTSQVMERTLEQAEVLGLSVVTLPVLNDIDVAADLTPTLLESLS